MVRGDIGSIVNNFAFLKNEADADLIVYMALKQEDQLLAKAAWVEFYGRHKEYIYRRCRKVLRKKFEGRTLATSIDEIVINLVSDTFLKAYERAETFKVGRYESADKMRGHVRKWLESIAWNELKQRIGLVTDIETVENIDDYQPPKIDPPSNSRLISCARQAIEALPEKEKSVLLTYLDYFSIYDGWKRLPNNVAKNLAEALGLSTVSLRKYRDRAQERVKKFLAECQRIVTSYGETDDKKGK